MPELDTTKLCKDCKNAIVYGLPRGCYCQLTKKADGINPVTGEPQTHTHNHVDLPDPNRVTAAQRVSILCAETLCQHGVTYSGESFDDDHLAG